MSWTLNSKNNGVYWIALNDAIEKYSVSKWACVNFNIMDSKFVPETSGIYIISSGLPKTITIDLSNSALSRFSTPHYVGQSINLRERMKSHCKSDSENIVKIKNIYSSADLKFNFIEAQKEKIDILETLAYRCFRTDANIIDTKLSPKNKELLDDLILEAERKKL